MSTETRANMEWALGELTDALGGDKGGKLAHAIHLFVLYCIDHELDKRRPTGPTPEVYEAQDSLTEGEQNNELANRKYERGAHCLMQMMQAYERRIRSDCTTSEQLAAKPWECMEYIAAANFLRATWVASGPTPVAHGDDVTRWGNDQYSQLELKSLPAFDSARAALQALGVESGDELTIERAGNQTTITIKHGVTSEPQDEAR